MKLAIGEVVHLRGGTVDWVVVDKSKGVITLVPLAFAHPNAWRDSPWILTTQNPSRQLLVCNCFT